VNKLFLSSEEALKILKKSGCSSQIVQHCQTVAKVAVRIAKKCSLSDNNINIHLVLLGGLLHDLGRSKTHSNDHPIVGANIAKKLGLHKSIVSIIEKHMGGGITSEEAQKLGWPVKSYLPLTNEEKIVAYADKLVEGVRITSFDNTIQRLKQELGNDHPAINRVYAIHEQISFLCCSFK
jgi:uncharacterized protein